MPYRVFKKDSVIESADEIKVDGGVLITYEDLTVGYIENKRVVSMYAPGQWDIAFWDDPDAT